MDDLKFSSLQSALDSLIGSPVRIVSQSRISGGDINDAFALTLETATTLPIATSATGDSNATKTSRKIFMKSNARQYFSMFEAEATGLSALASSGKIATPKILALGTDEEKGVGFSFLLLDFVESATPVKNYWRIFGRELAELHKADCSQFSRGKQFGFTSDNFIGRTKQINTPYNSWVEFFRDNRLRPQFEMSKNYFDADFLSKTDKFLDHLDNFLIEPDFPSLIHGDLWRGNALCGNDGKAMLIDPAAYVGFFEADLAMTELFGGFPRDFYEGYYEVTPKIKDYEIRREIYNLYHLLNHLNLFGSSYLGAVYHIVRRFV